MKPLINIYLAMILFAKISFPQEITKAVPVEKRHLLTLSTGISLHSVRDEMMSPLMYDGSQIPVPVQKSICSRTIDQISRSGQIRISEESFITI